MISEWARLQRCMELAKARACLNNSENCEASRMQSLHTGDAAPVIQ